MGAKLNWSLPEHLPGKKPAPDEKGASSDRGEEDKQRAAEECSKEGAGANRHVAESGTPSRDSSRLALHSWLSDLVVHVYMCNLFLAPRGPTEGHVLCAGERPVEAGKGRGTDGTPC